jgi:hypothetical protein
MAMLKARTEFASALNQICAEHGIEPEVVIQSIKDALLAAYRRDFGLKEEMEYEVEVDQETGESRILTWQEGKKKLKKILPLLVLVELPPRWLNKYSFRKLERQKN